MRAAVNALCVIFVCCCCYWMIPCQAEFVNMSMAKDYLYGGPDVDLFWPGEEENRKDEEAVKEGNNEEEEEPERVESDEQRLMRRLVSGYDNSVRPVYQAQEPVDVLLGLTLTQILDLDEKNQVLTTNVWLEASWYDQRLNWTASEFGGITSIRIPCHKLWLPDIVLYNSVDDYTQGYMPSLAMVYDDSRVFWGPVIRFRSSCKIDITFFPFDTQMCRLKMGSWAYTGEQVNVWNSSTSMDLSNFVDNGEWELLGVAVQRNIVYYNCCPEMFPDVTFTIQLRRRTKYYFMNIIIPCIILSFLCLGGFLLPAESGEKITLGLSVLLTITVFMLMVADKMPQTSESISVISIYLMVVLATSCLSVLSSVLVLSIHHQRGRPSRPPLWLRRFCFSIISPLFCIRRPDDGVTASPRKRGPRQGGCGKDSFFRTGGSRVASGGEECEYLRMDPRPGSGGSNPDRVDVNKLQKGSLNNHYYDYTYTPATGNKGPGSGGGTGDVHSGARDEDSRLPPSRDDWDTREDVGGGKHNLVVRHLIGLIHTQRNEEMRDEEVFQEWHHVAYVLDRMLFAFFFLLTLVSTVCILEMRPTLDKL